MDKKTKISAKSMDDQTPPTARSAGKQTSATVENVNGNIAPVARALDEKTPLAATSKIRDLEKFRVDPEPGITTNQGLPISDDNNSLKAGERGPTLLEDFNLRKKINHFDHERIPERVVHARGVAVHGYFQVYESLAEYTTAKVLTDPGVQTPVFVRFSTVLGSRGAAETTREVRGFSVRFYTEEGNWDLVGNNIPVFFIQDAIKFPDLIHAAKPEPDKEIPQSSTAHDTFWDYISLTPESMHMIMWAMSDRALPRSYAMVEGFGVHTFRLVNAQGKSTYVKFHWKPLLGVRSLVWDEAQKLAGKDPDFLRRDLYEAIELGNYPEYELGLQLFSEEDAAKFDFDVLDATKIIPEDLVPVKRVGKMTLNRKPDNYFAETEQVAYNLENIVPGIGFSNDPLLQGRLFSYLDTHLLRLGGPNFTEIPINKPLAKVANNERDSFHRQQINPGRVSYEPSALDGNIPVPTDVSAAQGGYVAYPEQVEGPKIRKRSESFGDHYGQARLFWNSMMPIERTHIVMALQFELGKVETSAVRERMIAHLAQINDTLAAYVGAAIGVTPPAPKTGATMQMPNGTAAKAASINTAVSGALSLTTASGGLERASGLSQEEVPVMSVKGRRVAILTADGSSASQIEAIKGALVAGGAKGEVIAPHLGAILSAEGKSVPVDRTYATTASVMYDGILVPGGAQGVAQLKEMGDALEYLAEAYKHSKPIAAVAEGIQLVAASDVGRLQQFTTANTPPVETAKGVVTGADIKAVTEGFLAALPIRHWDRVMDAVAA